MTLNIKLTIQRRISVKKMSAKKGQCKICDSKSVSTINKMLLNGDTIAKIHHLFPFARGTITKHRDTCMAGMLQKINDKKEIIGDSLVKQVEADIVLVHKLVRACDEWLTDPDDPSKYFLGPRGQEIDITYQETDPETGRLDKMMKKASLQEMIHAIEAGGFVIRNITTKQADPRELLLKAIGKLEGIVKMILETTQNEIENKHKRAAIDKASKDGSVISFEKQISQITERVTIAMKGSNSEELCKLAELPEL